MDFAISGGSHWVERGHEQSFTFYKSMHSENAPHQSFRQPNSNLVNGKRQSVKISRSLCVPVHSEPGIVAPRT